jgi:putative spermidine/putrescine transport system permease protein
VSAQSHALDTAVEPLSAAEPERLPAWRRMPLAWLGVVPFLAFATFFLLLPAGVVMVGAFRDSHGSWSLDDVKKIVDEGQFRNAYWTSIELSLTSAAIGALIGFLMAYGMIAGGAPRFVRTTVTAFSGVAANFAGVPLAFAFIATLGINGIVTRFLFDHLNIDLYFGWHFAIYSFWGVVLAYVYFQIPLMILVVAPAIDGLKQEWREAAESLGAGSTTYWWRVGLPVLTPALLGAFFLLFVNAFSAYATAQALSSGGVNIVPILIAQAMSGNVFNDPHLGHALGFGMIVVIVAAMVPYYFLSRRASRWRR